jgi:hypothetical protein
MFLTKKAQNTLIVCILNMLILIILLFSSPVLLNESKDYHKTSNQNLDNSHLLIEVYAQQIVDILKMLGTFDIVSLR